MATVRNAELTEQRDAAATAYYEGESVMTDDAFDALESELAALGVEETVGHGYVPAGKVAHQRRMLSIAKVHTEDEVAKFIERVGGAARVLRFSLVGDDGVAVSNMSVPASRLYSSRNPRCGIRI